MKLRFLLFPALCALALTACTQTPEERDIDVVIGESTLEPDSFMSDALTLRVLGRGRDADEFVARDKALAEAKGRLLRELCSEISFSESGDGLGEMRVKKISGRIENVVCAGTHTRRNLRTGIYTVVVGIEFPRKNLQDESMKVVIERTENHSAAAGIPAVPPAAASGKVAVNPFDYMESGEKMGVVVYVETDEGGRPRILGVESCAVGTGGYSGCAFTYRTTGDAECHAHFRDKVHVTRANGGGRVIACDADGKFRSWERGEYAPDEHFEKVIRLNASKEPLVAVLAQKSADGGWRFSPLADRALLKTALELLKSAGETNAYFVSRYGNVSGKN